jgi:hypothetical protein
MHRAGWRPMEFRQGKTIKNKSFPKDHKVSLFRVELSIRRTVRAVTDDRHDDRTRGVQLSLEAGASRKRTAGRA